MEEIQKRKETDETRGPQFTKFSGFYLALAILLMVLLLWLLLLLPTLNGQEFHIISGYWMRASNHCNQPYIHDTVACIQLLIHLREKDFMP